MILHLTFTLFHSLFQFHFSLLEDLERKLLEKINLTKFCIPKEKWKECIAFTSFWSLYWVSSASQSIDSSMRSTLQLIREGIFKWMNKIPPHLIFMIQWMKTSQWTMTHVHQLKTSRDVIRIMLVHGALIICIKVNACWLLMLKSFHQVCSSVIKCQSSKSNKSSKNNKSSMSSSKRIMNIMDVMEVTDTMVVMEVIDITVAITVTITVTIMATTTTTKKTATIFQKFYFTARSSLLSLRFSACLSYKDVT